MKETREQERTRLEEHIRQLDDQLDSARHANRRFEQMYQAEKQRADYTEHMCDMLEVTVKALFEMVITLCKRRPS